MRCASEEESASATVMSLRIWGTQGVRCPCDVVADLRMGWGLGVVFSLSPVSFSLSVSASNEESAISTVMSLRIWVG